MANKAFVFSDSQYMRIDEEVTAGRKTPIFLIAEKCTFSELGEIKWHAPWRSFCFFPEGGCVFDSGCVEMILEWVKAANEQYKRARRKGKTDNG
jgi:hypothetical protein